MKEYYPLITIVLLLITLAGMIFSIKASYERIAVVEAQNAQLWQVLDKQNQTIGELLKRNLIEDCE